MSPTTRTAAQTDERLLDSYPLLAEGFRRALLAQNKSPRTIQTYGEALTIFGRFLEALSDIQPRPGALRE